MLSCVFPGRFYVHVYSLKSLDVLAENKFANVLGNRISFPNSRTVFDFKKMLADLF